MRQIKRIFVHCTASNQKWGVKELLAEFKAKGWRNPGYHKVVTADGVVHQLLDISKVSNGVQGYNSTAINIAYVGGIDGKGKPVDNRTEAQKVALRSLLVELHHKFPNATIIGHRDIWGSNPKKWNTSTIDYYGAIASNGSWNKTTEKFIFGFYYNSSGAYNVRFDVYVTGSWK